MGRLWWALVASLMGIGCGTPQPLPVEGDPCRSLADCAQTPGLSCMLGSCQRVACERSVACPVEAACIEGVCGAPQCERDEDCQGGGRCFEGACRQDICRDKSECASEQVCLGTPSQCRAAPAVCVRDEECPGRLACDVTSGQCSSTCDNDATCGASRLCVAGRCLARCADSAECRAGALCREGACQLPLDCSGLGPCAASAPLRRPEDCACVSCLQDADCDLERGEACLQFSCKACVLRTSDADVCAASGLQQLDGCCVRCLNALDCDVAAGQVCQRGRCVDGQARACASDQDCRAAERCDGQRCAPPVSLAACALQADCPLGEGCVGGRCRALSGSCAEACPAPSRCVGQPGDAQGACVGCVARCQAQGCPQGTLCYMAPDEAEGLCVDAAFYGPLCEF